MTTPYVNKSQITYKCDTCSRYIKLEKNIRGMETLQQCIITENCLGKLHYVLAERESAQATTIPPDVVGLENWAPRKIFYRHIQTVPAQTWLVMHDLGVKPSVQVWTERQLQGGDTFLEERIPEQVIVINPNQVNLLFNNAESGIADCISSSSGFNFDATPEQNQTVPTILLTTNNELTIATLDTTPLITFEVTFIIAGEPFQVVYTNVDDVPSINTPWVGANKIYLNGKTYTVRSFDFREQPFANSVFNSNLIPDGAPFYFSGGLDFSTAGTNFILLSDPPYSSTVDRVDNKLIDIASINTTAPQTKYSAGELVSTTTIIKGVYPPIITVD